MKWDAAKACSYVFLSNPCRIKLIMHTHRNTSVPTISRIMSYKLHLVQNFCSCLRLSVPKQHRQQKKKHRYQRAQFILRESLPVCFKGLCGEWQHSDEWCLCARSWRRESRGSRRAYLTDECPACATRVRDSPCSVSLKARGHRGWTQ